MNFVAMAIDILRGTPSWVFLLAALLVWLGVRSLRPRVTSAGRVLMTPSVFIVWGVASFMTGASSTRAVVWIVAAGAGLGLAILTVRLRGLLVDRAHRLVLMPGSALPLARNLVVFSAKYALAVGAVLQPDAREELAVWDAAVSGASAGYFFGWVLRFAHAYRNAPGTDLVAPNRGSDEAAPPQRTVVE